MRSAFTHSGLTSGNPHSVTPTELSLVIGTNVLAEQTIGIADDNLVEMDDADAADNDYCKLTANGIEGRSYAEVLSDLSGQASSAFDLNGQDLTNGGVIFLTEQAAAEADVAGKGQFWVKTVTPNEPWFTDDAGNDIPLRGLIDRGDPSSHDFSKTDFTTDATWRDLDLSSIVPAGAKMVNLIIYGYGDTANATMSIRKNGNSNAIVALSGTTPAVGIAFLNVGVIACDSSRVVEYNISNITWTALNLSVAGWSF
jgi:hypothetical protein